MRNLTYSLLLLFLTIISVNAVADEGSELLLGDLHDSLKDAGVDFGIAYTGDVVGNVAGGIEKKAGYLGDLSLTTEFDFEKIAGAKGLKLNLHALGDHGAKPTEFVGDTLGTSNIEAPSTFKLYEAYLTKSFEDRFSLSLGLIDLNASFYATETSSFFRNGAFGISPTLSQTGANGPSIFPNTAVALTSKYQSESSFYFQSGVFNAIAGNPNDPYGTHVTWSADDGYLLIWEAGSETSDEASAHKYAFGLWTYSAPTNWGAYLLLDQKFSEHLSAFVKYGYATPKVNEVSNSIEAGTTYQGLFSSRPEDILGFGVATAFLRSPGVSMDSPETALELSYSAPICAGLTLTPDLQYIVAPGSANLDNAFVTSLRFVVEI